MHKTPTLRRAETEESLGLAGFRDWPKCEFQVQEKTLTPDNRQRVMGEMSGARFGSPGACKDTDIARAHAHTLTESQTDAHISN